MTAVVGSRPKTGLPVAGLSEVTLNQPVAGLLHAFIQQAGRLDHLQLKIIPKIANTNFIIN